ncbi:pyrimidine dimer DNA glycosylase/endonuclease V [Candidatus Omnitrophota bacterium]
MRIWDIPPRDLCRAHLLGEHRELHALWSVVTKGKKGYASHPETMRWRGKLSALFRRHEKLVKEMKKRDYQHHSTLPQRLAVGGSNQRSFIDTLKQ